MVEQFILILAAVLMGLLVGLFFAFEVSVNDALRTLQDNEYVRAMQSINRVILNPLFFCSFFGPVVLMLVVVIFFNHGIGSVHFWLLLSSGLLYTFGTCGITMASNVPLNERLDKFDVTKASTTAIKKARTEFERPWNLLHTIRTWIGIAAFTVLLIALVI